MNGVAALEEPGFVTRLPVGSFHERGNLVNSRAKTLNSIASDRWAVVLAGGDGARLREFTRVITGDDRPKQFCPIVGEDTLIEQTRKRITRALPDERVIYVFTQKHRRFYEPWVAKVSKQRVVVQPENKGTAAGILYALIRLSLLSENATVAFFPSDHYIADEPAFTASIEKAYRAAEASRRHVVLLGFRPDSPETEYGWIETDGRFNSSVLNVAKFWEKPSQERANLLYASGCLWNSFVMVGNVSAFLGLIGLTQPQMMSDFSQTRLSVNMPYEEDIAIRDLYKAITPLDFSRDVLQKRPDLLVVLPVPNVGWNDMGQSSRVKKVLNSLDRTLVLAKAA